MAKKAKPTELAANDPVKAMLAALEKRPGNIRISSAFRDFCHILSLEFQAGTTLDKDGQKRMFEERDNILKAYGGGSPTCFLEATTVLVEALERKREDLLGHVMEVIQATEKGFGQFFTPTCVSRMMAAVTCGDDVIEKGKREIITLNDCACGASVLLIEAAEHMIGKGVPQGNILIFAEDIDSMAVDISYVQMTLLGYAAVVQRKNSITTEQLGKPLYTLGYFAHAMPMRWEWKKNTGDNPVTTGEDVPHEPPAETPPDVDVGKLTQGMLF